MAAPHRSHIGAYSAPHQSSTLLQLYVVLYGYELGWPPMVCFFFWLRDSMRQPTLLLTDSCLERNNRRLDDRLEWGSYLTPMLHAHVACRHLVLLLQFGATTRILLVSLRPWWFCYMFNHDEFQVSSLLVKLQARCAWSCFCFVCIPELLTYFVFRSYRFIGFF